MAKMISLNKPSVQQYYDSPRISEEYDQMQKERQKAHRPAFSVCYPGTRPLKFEMAVPETQQDHHRVANHVVKSTVNQINTVPNPKAGKFALDHQSTAATQASSTQVATQITATQSTMTDNAFREPGGSSSRNTIIVQFKEAEEVNVVCQGCRTNFKADGADVSVKSKETFLLCDTHCSDCQKMIINAEPSNSKYKIKEEKVKRQSFFCCFM